MDRERIGQEDTDSSLRENGIGGMDRGRPGYLWDDCTISARLEREPSGEQ